MTDDRISNSVIFVGLFSVTVGVESMDVNGLIFFCKTSECVELLGPHHTGYQ